MKTLFINKNVGIPVDVSIIVVFRSFPNVNLESLLNSTKRITVKYEVILVTNYVKTGVDAQKALLPLLEDKPNLITLRLVLMDSNVDRSAAFGRNLGAVLANSPILLFADDDSMVLDDISSLLRHLQNGEFQGVQPLILRLANKETIDSAGDFIKQDGKMYKPYVKGAGVQLRELLSDLYPEEVPSLRSAFMLVKKDAFLAVGGMDNTFIFNFEDVDLGWRMTCAGYNLLFDPSIRAVHKGSRTTGEAKTISEKVIKLGLLNLYALNLKINTSWLWPYLLIQFQKELISYEVAAIKSKRLTLPEFFLEILTMNKNFMKRFHQARVHRGILSKNFQFKGRQRLEYMAQGKRFLCR